MENAKNNKNCSMIECGKPYRFRKEFCPMLSISDYQVTRRKKDLLDWLTNFYDYDFKEAPSESAIIIIKEIIGGYQQMPRKLPKQDALTQQKKKEYGDYTIASLTPQFQPESGCHIARNAIDDFGYFKYGHTSDEWVARNYVMPALKKHGEKSNRYVWVWYINYRPLNEEELDAWLTILREENIDEKAAANAFYRKAKGENIDKEINYYQKALKRIQKLYNKIPVNVSEWRLRQIQ